MANKRINTRFYAPQSGGGGGRGRGRGRGGVGNPPPGTLVCDTVTSPYYDFYLVP